MLVAAAGLGLVMGAALGSVQALVLRGRVSHPWRWTLGSALVGASAASRFVLTSPAHRLLGRSLVGLRLRGAVTGRPISLPVMYASDASSLVVLPGRPDRKRWWRNLRRSTDLMVFMSGHWSPAVGAVLRSGQPGYDRARSVYLDRWRRARIDPDAPLVRIAIGR